MTFAAFLPIGYAIWFLNWSIISWQALDSFEFDWKNTASLQTMTLDNYNLTKGGWNLAPGHMR